ncbi:MAG: hypothetical protein OXC62_11190 [Aestuariivita sp.]|nr:hypothetical protein [Aestuariivita sp.]
MFIRVKSTPNSPRTSVQIVQSVRVNGKIRQRILRYVGVAHDDQEKQAPWKIAEHIKAKMFHEPQPSLFPPEYVTEMAIESRRKPKHVLPIDNLSSLYEEQRAASTSYMVASTAISDLITFSRHNNRRYPIGFCITRYWRALPILRVSV